MLRAWYFLVNPDGLVPKARLPVGGEVLGHFDLLTSRPAIIALAFLLDRAIGNPRWLPHPVVAMGKGAQLLEGISRRVVRRVGRKNAMGATLEFCLGCVTVYAVVGGSWLAANLLLAAAARIWGDAGRATAEALLLYSALGSKSLEEHLDAVRQRLVKGDLPGARKAVGMVVGRDTHALDESEICRAAVETAAESFSDGLVASLFFGVLGGAPLAMAYKAVNTLDSMIGFADERYRYFGKCAARADDAANFLPARLSVVFLVAAGIAVEAMGARAGGSRNGCRQDVRRADRGTSWRAGLAMAIRDGAKHPSPNSGYPEAAMAGLTGTRLGGLNYYGGKQSFRPYLGDPVRPLSVDRVIEAITLINLGSYVAVLVAVATATVLSP